MSAPVQRVLAALEARGRVKVSGGRWTSCCPAHADTTPSLTISEADDGRALVHCHAGCTVEDVVAALGLTLPDLFDEVERDAQQMLATYDYWNAAGSEVLFQVVRYAGKSFKQRRPAADGEWIWNLGDTERVLYNFPLIVPGVRNGEVIYITEGEKDVHSLIDAGVIATCNSGGAGKWRSAYSEVLRGADVVIVRDRDEPGHKHAEHIAASLHGIAKSVRIVEAKTGKDASDHLHAGHAVDDFVPVEPAPNEHASDDPPFVVRTVGEILAAPEPDRGDQLLGPLVVRGERTIIGGHTGEGKTTFTTQIARTIANGGEFLEWSSPGGGRVLIIDAEQNDRAIRIRLTEAGFDTTTDNVHVVSAPAGLDLVYNDQNITALEAALASGRYDLVVVDPLYKLHRGEANDEREMGELMRRLDDWRTKYHFALLLPAHFRKPAQEGRRPTIHDISGSSVIVRGAEVVLAIQRVREGGSRLIFHKDRVGDLPAGPWLLLFDRTTGYRRDPDDGKPRDTAVDLVRGALAAEPGLTYNELVDRLPYTFDTVRKAVKTVDPVAVTDTDGAKHWTLRVEPIVS